MYSKQKKKQHERENYLKNNIQLYHNRKSAWLFVFKHHQEACPHGQHIQSPAREDATKNPLWILVHNKMKHRVILIQPILLCIPAVTKYDSIFCDENSGINWCTIDVASSRLYSFSTTFGILIVSPDMISIYHLAAIKPPYIVKSFSLFSSWLSQLNEPMAWIFLYIWC